MNSRNFLAFLTLCTLLLAPALQAANGGNGGHGGHSPGSAGSEEMEVIVDLEVVAMEELAVVMAAMEGILSEKSCFKYSYFTYYCDKYTQLVC